MKLRSLLGAAQTIETQIRLERRVGKLHLRGRADGYDPRAWLPGRSQDDPRPGGRHPGEPPAAAPGAVAVLRRPVLCGTRAPGRSSSALCTSTSTANRSTCGCERFTAAQLEAVLLARCERSSAAWADCRKAHTAPPATPACARLAFPLNAFRSGQRALSETVYRASGARSLPARRRHPPASARRWAALYPMLRAIPEAVAGQGGLPDLQEHSPRRCAGSLVQVADHHAGATPARAGHSVERARLCAARQGLPRRRRAHWRGASTTASPRRARRRWLCSGSMWTAQRWIGELRMAFAPTTWARNCCAGRTCSWPMSTTPSIRTGSCSD